MSQDKPQAPIKPTLKIVPMEIDKDFQAPEGWTMRELMSVAVGNEAQFFAVLMLLPPQPPAPAAPKKPGIIT